MRRFYFLLLGLLCLYHTPLFAQVSFKDPVNPGPDSYFDVNNKVVNDQNNPVLVAPSGNTTLTFNARLFKLASYSTQGYVDLYLGNASNGTLAPNPLTNANTRPQVFGGWVPVYNQQSNPSGYESYTVSSPSTPLQITATDVGSYTALYAVYVSTSSGSPQKIAYSNPVYIKVNQPTTQPPTQPDPWMLTSVRLTSQLNGTNTVSTAGSNRKLFAFLGAQLSINGTGTDLNKLTYVQFRSTNLLFSSTPTTVATTGTFPAPARGYYYLNFVGANKGDTYGVQVIRPRSDFFPCDNAIVCSDQCIPNGSAPALLTGRLLATPSSEFDDYDEYLSYTGDTRLLYKEETEAVQWQSHLDGGEWQDISGATSRNYQPGPQTYTTYYRRVSTHLEGKFRVRRFWYNSNVVTVTVQAAVPQVTQSSYTVSACGNGTSTLTLSLVDGAYHYANSWNWDAPYAGWTIGDATRGPQQTGPGYGSFVTEFGSVTLNIPTTTPAGTYAVTVSGNGGCGGKSGDATIYITITSGALPGGVSRFDFYQSNNSDYCTYYYDVSTDIVPGVDSYFIMLGNGQRVDGQIMPQYNIVYFPISIVASNGSTVTVTSVNSCGTTDVTSPPQYYPSGNTGDPNCRLAHPNTGVAQESVDKPEMGVYPNPAHDVLTVSALGRPAVATFYDAQGVVQRTVRLTPKQTSLVNVLDLPAGLYHVRVVADGATLLEQQLVIKH